MLFTSGATGPAKGVVYRHRQLRAQLDLVRRVCDLQPGRPPGRGLPPFALYGRLWVPPPPYRTWTDQARHPDRHRTGRGRRRGRTPPSSSRPRPRCATSPPRPPTSPPSCAADSAASGPCCPPARPSRCRCCSRSRRCCRSAELHTPYGMTEALPATDITLDGDRAGPRRRRTGARTASASAARCPACASRSTRSTSTGRPDRRSSSTAPGVTGEICVAAAHVKDHYDRLWSHPAAQRDPAGWHRTGDVGHLDDAGTALGRRAARARDHRSRRTRSRRSGSSSGSRAVLGVELAAARRRRTGRHPAERRRGRAGDTSDPRTARRPLTSAAAVRAGRRRPASPPCWSPTGCRSTSGTPPRSTGPGWRAGPTRVLAGRRTAGPTVGQ